MDISNTGKKKTFTCQNPSCSKTFTSALKTLNLQHPQYPYASCPYCLTKIEMIDTSPKTIEKSKKTSLNEVQPKNNHTTFEIKHAKNCEKPAACQYHLGFLSERKLKQQIPDSCLVCKDSIECMLMKMRE